MYWGGREHLSLAVSPGFLPGVVAPFPGPRKGGLTCRARKEEMPILAPKYCCSLFCSVGEEIVVKITPQKKRFKCKSPVLIKIPQRHTTPSWMKMSNRSLQPYATLREYKEDEGLSEAREPYDRPDPPLFRLGTYTNMRVTITVMDTGCCNKFFSFL
jgi:hypothetical protein